MTPTTESSPCNRQRLTESARRLQAYESFEYRPNWAQGYLRGGKEWACIYN